MRATATVGSGHVANIFITTGSQSSLFWIQPRADIQLIVSDCVPIVSCCNSSTRGCATISILWSSTRGLPTRRNAGWTALGSHVDMFRSFAEYRRFVYVSPFRIRPLNFIHRFAFHNYIYIAYIILYGFTH